MTKETEYAVYYDPGRGQMYVIKWYDTGNSEIPTRYYLRDSFKVDRHLEAENKYGEKL